MLDSEKSRESIQNYIVLLDLILYIIDHKPHYIKYTTTFLKEATDIGFGRFNSYLIVLSSISASSGLASSKSIFHQKKSDRSLSIPSVGNIICWEIQMIIILYILLNMNMIYLPLQEFIRKVI
eukprot:524545_1